MLVWKKAPWEISSSQPAELLAQALLAEHAGRAVGAARVALDHRVEVDRAACGKRAGEVTRRVWIWPVRRPSRTTRLRSTPSRAAPVVGGDRLEPGPVADLVAGRVAALGGEPAVLDADDQVPAAAGVEAERSARRRASPKEYSSLLR